MTSRRSDGVLRGVRAVFRAGAAGVLTDGQLLERFLTRHGEAAEAVVRAWRRRRERSTATDARLQ